MLSSKIFFTAVATGLLTLTGVVKAFDGEGVSYLSYNFMTSERA
jgi:hypothetical protein